MSVATIIRQSQASRLAAGLAVHIVGHDGRATIGYAENAERVARWVAYWTGEGCAAFAVTRDAFAELVARMAREERAVPKPCPDLLAFLADCETVARMGDAESMLDALGAVVALENAGQPS